MVEENLQEQEKEFQGGFYEKHYKKLLVIPIILFLAIIGILGYKLVSGQDIVKKDITLTGGISVTLNTEKEIDIVNLQQELGKKFGEVLVRRISEVGIKRNIGLIIEAKTEDADALKTAIDDLVGIRLTEENSSVQITGSSLGKSFSSQLFKALIIAFIFMATVVFIIFRNFVPSLLVIFAGVGDILTSLTYASITGMHIGTAGIAAFLMLIGYSIDTDILLTTRMLKRKEKHISQRMLESFKTGIMMTIISLAVMLIAAFFVISPELKQIFVIMSVGLIADIIFTWCFNAPALRIYLEKTGKVN